MTKLRQQQEWQSFISFAEKAVDELTKSAKGIGSTPDRLRALDKAVGIEWLLSSIDSFVTGVEEQVVGKYGMDIVGLIQEEHKLGVDNE